MRSRLTYHHVPVKHVEYFQFDKDRYDFCYDKEELDRLLQLEDTEFVRELSDCSFSSFNSPYNAALHIAFMVKFGYVNQNTLKVHVRQGIKVLCSLITRIVNSNLEPMTRRTAIARRRDNSTKGSRTSIKSARQVNMVNKILRSTSAVDIGDSKHIISSCAQEDIRISGYKIGFDGRIVVNGHVMYLRIRNGTDVGGGQNDRVVNDAAALAKDDTRTFIYIMDDSEAMGYLPKFWSEYGDVRHLRFCTTKLLGLVDFEDLANGQTTHDEWLLSVGIKKVGQY